MPSRPHTFFERLVALLLVASLLSWGACLPSTPLEPVPGLPDAARDGLVAVPGGYVDAAGGNLRVERVDLSLDTPLGTHEIRAVYNSASGAWLWNFQMSYDGTRLVDPTGAVHPDISPDGGLLTPDGTVPGTIWVRVDDDTVRTKGGLAHHFDAAGALAHIAWATLDYPRIEFTATAIRQCLQAGSCTTLYELELDENGNPLRVVDARTGRTASFTYDGTGRLETARSPLAVSQGWPGFRYEYDGSDLLTAVTNSEGERIEYEYQAGRRILHVTRVGEGDPRHRFEFYGEDAALGRWSTVHTNPLGGVTRYHYDHLRRLREIERTLTGEVTVYAYGAGSLPALLRPASITRPSGARTAFSVDANDDVVEITKPGGNVLRLSYATDALNLGAPDERPPRRLEDSLGLVAETHYGPDGRFTRVDRAEGETTHVTHAGATLATATDVFGLETRYGGYGVHGHWIRATTAASPYPLQRAFDPVGNLLASAAVREDGGVLDRSYDDDRNVAAVHLAATDRGAVTASAQVLVPRRSDGRPLRIERPGGGDHVFVYDGLGRLGALRERVDGAWRETRFEHDAAGNVTARERPNGMRDEYGYDVYGRLTRRAALRHGVLEGEATITWSAGLPTIWTDSKRGVTETYGYDAAGRLRTLHYSSGETATLTRDVRGRITEIRLDVPGSPARRIATEYDLADRQTRVSLDGEKLAEMAYAAGRQVRVETGNGLVRIASHDPDTGRVTGFTTAHPVLGAIEQTWIERTALPERTLVATHTESPLASTEEQYSLGVGGLLSDPDRRVGSRVWGWEDGEGGSGSYRHDELGNLVANDAGDAFSYNAERNRLESATLAHGGQSLAYGYDEAGFVTSRNDVPVEWTASGRLVSVGSTAIEWDMAERPISITVGGPTHHFTRFGGAVRTDPGTGALLAVDLGVAAVSLASGARLYRHRDFRGNVSLLSDENGAIVAHHRYRAYGLDTVFATAGLDDGAARFAGGLELGEGLVSLGARVYDSRVGRFLSPDPVLQVASQHSYTHGDPVHFWDPDGAHAQSTNSAAEAEAKFTAAAGAAAVQVAVAAATTAVALASVGTPVAVPTAVLAAIEIGKAVVAIVEAVEAYQDWQVARARESTGLQGLERFGSGACKGHCGPGGPPGPGPSFEGGGCAPTQLHRVPLPPDPGGLLLFLVPLQIALAALALSRRRRGDET